MGVSSGLQASTRPWLQLHQRSGIVVERVGELCDLEQSRRLTSLDHCLPLSPEEY